MKKTVLKPILLASMLTIGITSCTNDEKSENVVKQEGAIEKISTGISTKAVDTNWQTGDAIGVTMYNADTTAILESQFNYQYVTDSAGPNGVFYPVATPLFFPQNGDQMRLKAYYPYYASLGTDMLYPVDVTNQLNLPAIDLMTSEHLNGFSKNDQNVELRFYHRLSKLIFQLDTTAETSGLDLSTCSLTIRQMQGGNTYDIRVDNFLMLATGEVDITVPKHTGEDPDIRQAIVLPREAGPGVDFIFSTPNGDTYIATMSSTLELKGGNQYTFIIKLSRNPVTVTADIEPWIPDAEETYEAK